MCIWVVNHETHYCPRSGKSFTSHRLYTTEYHRCGIFTYPHASAEQRSQRNIYRDPNATPYVPKYTPYNPTPTSYTTPFPFAEIWDDMDTDYTLTQEKISKMLAYRFDYEDNLDIKPQSDFTSKEEYTEFIKSECEKRYKANVEYLKSHEINTLYIKMDVGRDSNTRFEGKIYGKTTNAEEISAWKNAVLSLPAEKCSEYSIDPHRFTGGFTTVWEQPILTLKGLYICPMALTAKKPIFSGIIGHFGKSVTNPLC